ncbi:MAG TPA: growth inhibitor PemK [Caulobacteraceae bacterium]|nr:growth inhibitor PemK [Caulobacteraceae bacterium]
MARLPAPRPGLVIRYGYLWREEALRGRLEGIKDRPCVVVLAVTRDAGRTVVTVAPITHSAPRAPGEAVELPPQTLERLGLGVAWDWPGRSWIVATEVNQFEWPGPDLRPARAGEWAFGFIPGALLRKLREAMTARRRLGVSRRGG